MQITSCVKNMCYYSTDNSQKYQYPFFLFLIFILLIFHFCPVHSLSITLCLFLFLSSFFCLCFSHSNSLSPFSVIFCCGILCRKIIHFLRHTSNLIKVTCENSDHKTYYLHLPLLHCTNVQFLAFINLLFKDLLKLQ